MFDPRRKLKLVLNTLVIVCATLTTIRVRSVTGEEINIHTRVKTNTEDMSSDFSAKINVQFQLDFEVEPLM